MAKDDFFQEEKEEKQEEQEPEKIKLGEEEYTQEELSKLVGIGKVGLEAQEKYKTDITKVWPEYTKKSQELAEYKEKVKGYEEKEKQALTEKVNQGEQLSPEEVKKQALAQADELGLIHKGNVTQFVNQVLAAKDLINDTEKVVTEAKNDGKPETTVDELLKYMDETGFKSPEKAYKDMFENELDKWKEQQMTKLKQPGMITEGSSTAGAKQPEPVKVTNDNLNSMIHSVLNRE